METNNYNSIEFEIPEVVSVKHSRSRFKDFDIVVRVKEQSSASDWKVDVTDLWLKGTISVGCVQICEYNGVEKLAFDIGKGQLDEGTDGEFVKRVEDGYFHEWVAAEWNGD